LIKRTVIISALLLLALLAPQMLSSNSAQAATAGNCSGSSTMFLGIPTWYKYLPHHFNTATNECVIGEEDNNGGASLDVPKAIAPILLAIIEILLRVGTYLAVGIIIWGALQYQFSQGEPDRTKNARTTIINAVVGLVIAIFATAIVNLIGRNIF